MVYLGDPTEVKAETLSGSWLCHACRSMGMMGALYEDVENFFGGIFAWYGRRVARYPAFFIVIPLLLFGLLGVGIMRLESELDLETLYAPLDGMALHDKAYLSRMFPAASGNYFFRQAISSPMFVCVIAKSTSNESLSVSSAAFRDLYEAINANLSVKYDGTSLTYGDLCARRKRACVVDVKQSQASSSSSAGHQDMQVVKVRFSLGANDSIQRESIVEWQKEFLSFMGGYSSDSMQFRFVASQSLDIESQSQVLQDTKYLGFGIMAIVVFSIFTGSGGNCVNNHTNLALTGVFAALLSMVAAFGTLGLLHSKIVSLCGIMPFLILGIGTDDIFQLMTEWRQGNIRDSVEDRMAQTLRSAAVSITITSMTDLIAFCIGACCPYVSVRNFCACCGLGVFLCYVNQLTFFSGCLALHGRRVAASRHWLACCKVKSQSEMQEERSHPILVKLCAGHPPRRIGEDGGVCKKISRVIYTYYPTFILHWITKIVVLIFFVLYIIVSVFFTFRVQKGFDLSQMASADSHYTRYMEWDQKYFPDDGPIVSLTVAQPMQYSRPGIRNHLWGLSMRAEKLPFVVNGSTISWVEAFYRDAKAKNKSTMISEPSFISSVQEFLDENEFYANDVVFSEKRDAIIASRTYIQCHQLNSSLQSEVVEQLRRVANSSPFIVTAYGPDFPLYEHNLTILRNTLLPVGVTLIGMLFVALVFVPHPIAVTCISISMLSVVVGMVGFMSLWGMSLSAVSTIQIILSIGISVSFTVHMCHAFMTATGKNRNERVTVALEKVGVPIINGALASLFCASMVAFGRSFIFASFFKTLTLVFFIGLLHSIVFLPVMLSFFGPRRTSKPRVFIPVSPSSRSLQDTYRANSIMRPPPSTYTQRSVRRGPTSVQTPLNIGDTLLEEEEEYAVGNFQMTLGGDDEDTQGKKKDDTLKRKVSFGKVSIGSVGSDTEEVRDIPPEYHDAESVTPRPSSSSMGTIAEEDNVTEAVV